MPIFGKLSPTNGCAISVGNEELRGKQIVASLLSDSGKPIHTGTLQVTKWKFINAPKDRIREWIGACGRTEADIRGRKNERNTVLYYLDPAHTYNLHFAELKPKASGAREVSSEPKDVVKAKKECLPDLKAERVSSIAGTPTRPQSLSGLRRNGWRDVPTQSGIYWWYFPEICVKELGIRELCDLNALKLRRSTDGKVCLYVGVGSSLRQRTESHANQRLTASALKSRGLSTFRKTLLALNWIEYETGFNEINRFMDGLDVSWLETACKQSAEELEMTELQGEFHYPLNIQCNRRRELRTYTEFLKQRRKEYKDHFIGR